MSLKLNGLRDGTEIDVNNRVGRLLIEPFKAGSVLLPQVGAKGHQIGTGIRNQVLQEQLKRADGEDGRHERGDGVQSWLFQ